MKLTVIAVLGLVLFAYCQEDDHGLAEMAAIIEPCIKESSVKPELVEKLFKNGDFAEDNNLKCFLKCLYTKDGIMSDNGSFNAEELKKTLEPDQSPDLVNKCKDLKGKDNCDTAFQVAKCMDG